MTKQNATPNGALLVTPSVSFARKQGKLWLDKKFVEGMRMNKRVWGGQVRAAMRETSPAALPFGDSFDLAELPFEFVELPQDGTIAPSVLDGVSVVLAGDMFYQYRLPDMRKEAKPAICYITEHDLKNRLRMVWQYQMPLAKRIKTILWHISMEPRRLSAMRRANAIQANGVNAFNRFRKIQPNTLLYFDTRMSNHLMATPSDIDKKAERLRSGAPLRLAFSGRLEAIKGVNHLPLVAKALAEKKIDFQFDIFGTGALEQKLKSSVDALGLADRVDFKGPVDFETALAPYVREHVDLFVCCHRQSDPSCTYLETYGCGVPIAGYDNAAFAGIQELSNAGWLSPMNKADQLADVITSLDADREQLIRHMSNALTFAGQHSFEATFDRRLGQLLDLTDK